MTKSREIRCFDYVNHPYTRVRDALVANALEIFRAAIGRPREPLLRERTA